MQVVLVEGDVLIDGAIEVKDHCFDTGHGITPSDCSQPLSHYTTALGLNFFRFRVIISAGVNKKGPPSNSADSRPPCNILAEVDAQQLFKGQNHFAKERVWYFTDQSLFRGIDNKEEIRKVC